MPSEDVRSFIAAGKKLFMPQWRSSSRQISLFIVYSVCYDMDKLILVRRFGETMNRSACAAAMFVVFFCIFDDWVGRSHREYIQSWRDR